MSEETITGTIQRVSFFKEGFLIARLTNKTAIKGPMLQPKQGIEYRFHGKWEEHPKYGAQFAFKTYEALVPKSPKALLAYLDANAKWIGPVIAQRLIDKFGDQTLEVLKNDPNSVALHIEGITIERAEKIAEDLNQHAATEHLELNLRDALIGVEISNAVFKRILDQYKSDAPSVVRMDPYRLAREIEGVSFVIADRIAQTNGLAKDHPSRLVEGVRHVLDQAAQSFGHVYLPRTEAIGDAKKLLDQPRIVIEDALRAYLDEHRDDNSHADLTWTDGEIALSYLRNAESTIANRIRDLMAADLEVAPLPDVTNLAPDQVEAVEVALNSGVFVLSGGAGTGKTTVVKHIIDGFHPNDIALCAPTGKASRRISELTGLEANTIHVLLEARPFGTGFLFTKHPQNPLSQKLIVCDESSMISVDLMAALLNAIQPGSRVIFIGDPYQLPSVGPGAVLADLISSGAVPHRELKTIKRQNPGMIIHNCKRIRDGIDIVENCEAFEPNQRDFQFIHAGTEKDAHAEILFMIEAYSRIVENPLMDIQVITALREKSELSVRALNQLIREYRIFHEHPNGVLTDEERKLQFIRGDKVIQRKNNYDLGVMNGDIGIVVNSTKDGVTVQFHDPERLIVFTGDNKLELAYAITTHSAQGSEWPVVIVICHPVLGQMIQNRPHLYTSLTRAKKQCILIGDMEEVRKVIQRSQPMRRFTKLRSFLKKANGG